MNADSRLPRDLACHGDSQRLGETSSYLRKPHLSEDKEERKCPLREYKPEVRRARIQPPWLGQDFSFPTANFKAVVQKSLLAKTINYILVDDFTESKCFCSRDDTPAGILTAQGLPRWK